MLETLRGFFRFCVNRESIDDVAEKVGLRTAATLRLHFRDMLATTPPAYRRRFSVGARSAGAPSRSRMR